MRRRKWRADEIRMVCSRYTEEGPSQLALDLGRTPNSVMSLANKLRLRSKNRWLRLLVTKKERGWISRLPAPSLASKEDLP